MTDTADLSPECAVGTKPGYDDLHERCCQTADIPLPGGSGIVLVPRCRCTCHHFRPQAPGKGTS